MVLGLFPPFPPRPEPVEAPAGAPSQEELVQNEIDHHAEINQTDWSGTPQNQAVQNELDYYNQFSLAEWPTPFS